VTRRVVITGMAGLSPIGQDWATARRHLLEGQSGVTLKPELGDVAGLETRLTAEVAFEPPDHLRDAETMGRAALMATRASELALASAGLLNDPLLSQGRVGVAFGSTSGSPTAIETFAKQTGVYRSLKGLRAPQFGQLMSHSCASNLAAFLGVAGRVIPTCSACTSGSQGIGYAYETVKWGLQDAMIAGGAEERHVICTAVFDIMRATSTRHDEPTRTPRPFDIDRDGLVVGEGAAALIVEALDHAQARGAPILAEIAGFATNSDGAHIVAPMQEGMERVQREALADAGLAPSAIDYVNAHGTGTEVGDIAESQATAAVFGLDTPISSLKGYMGHTLGACGAIEAWLCVHLLLEGWLAPNLNLERVDPRCAPMAFLTEARETRPRHIISNNFAFGGVNAALILKRWDG